MRMKTLLDIIKWLVLSAVAFVAFCNIWIVADSQEFVVEDSRALLGAEVGLVFGTSHRLVGGKSNPFFDNRVAAAKSLMLSAKVEKLILSGSKDSIYYDEAEAMRKALIIEGVVDNLLILDKYGNRTLESLRRLKEVYGYDQCILITQEYHAYRSVFLARKLGLSVQCFVADTPNRKDHFKALARELLARTKAILDLYVLRV